MKYPESFENLIECFKKLPGIGEKTAERLTLSIRNLDKEVIEMFSKSIFEVANNLKLCKNCNHITDKEICNICDDSNRKKNILCVVEDSKNIIYIEKLGVYDGLYHILQNFSLVTENFDLAKESITKLVNRIKEEKIEEIIFALKLTIEAETTILYIKKILENEKIKITKIAQGIPHGADIEYIDSLTLERALEDRISVS